MLEGEDFIIKIILVSFTMPILLSGLLIWFFISFNKRKIQHELEMKDAAIREQTLLLEKQNALQMERSRIAAEMHDDLGGGLTTIKFLGQKVMRNIDNPDQKDGVEKIIHQSKKLIENMGEIIWAMNADNDTLDKLIAYSRRFALEFLEEYDIDFTYKIEGEVDGIHLTGEKRRNFFLLLKESLHNIVKHADASKVDILWTLENDQLTLSISDNGKGLKRSPDVQGNGLKNMSKRAQDMGGEMMTKHPPNHGLVIIVSVPLAEKN